MSKITRFISKKINPNPVLKRFSAKFYEYPYSPFSKCEYYFVRKIHPSKSKAFHPNHPAHPKNDGMKPEAFF